MGNDDWEIKQAFAQTVHGANTGMILALLGIEVTGVKSPLRVLAIGAAGSIGYVKRGELVKMIVELIKRLIGK